VHGASFNFIEFVTEIIENEISSVTDNPIVFEEEDRIISAGNFHGQPLAIALDSLAIALAELGSISERRIYKLISGTRGLPAFLTPNPGINSGFMIAQYATAALVSKNKQLCTPASVDSIDSSNGQEDHVSMGANAATKCFQIMNNLEDILGTELMAGFQALEFRKPFKSSSKIEALRDSFRKEIPFIEDDVLMYVEMQKSKSFLLQNTPLI
jgi:histidine ammonia-lyase